MSPEGAPGRALGRARTLRATRFGPHRIYLRRALLVASRGNATSMISFAKVMDRLS
jgi:hypothetical protein